MDNRILYINGEIDKLLTPALELAFQQSGYRKNMTCSHYVEHPTKGLILLDGAPVGNAFGKVDPNVNKFLGSLSPAALTPIIAQWLKEQDPQKFELTSWEESIDFDGSLGKGFSLYCEDWGFVGEYRNAICAVKPSYMWYGK